MNNFFYNEWKHVIFDYFKVIKRNERNFEILFPAVLSLLISMIYWYFDKTKIALIELSNLLPTVLAILIGFTITSLSVIVTSDNENIKMLKNYNSDERIVGGKIVSIYRLTLINFSYMLIALIVLLIIVLFTLFIVGIWDEFVVCFVMLLFQVYLTIHIFLLMIRNITTFYLLHSIQK